MGPTLSVAIDRTQWGCINLFTIALIWQKRAIPLKRVFVTQIRKQ
ncbi:hypothetical protein QUA20_31525 [Microcoleus sp. Pol7_A1]